MKSTSMYTAVLALSLAMALAGGGLACRTFRERLDALEEQAVLQHQRNVCGWRTPLPPSTIPGAARAI